MRIITLLLFLGVFSLHATVTHSQNARVTINKNNTQLRQIINEIEKQTEYLFVYNDEIQVDKKVSVKASNEPVSKVLNDILKEMDITYAMEGTHIVLSKNLSAQEIAKTTEQPIKGTVVDNLGDPLIGVSVTIKGTTKGTMTDITGQFSLDVALNQILVVSYVGYTTKEITIKNDSPLKVELRESDISLETVVVTALGIRRSEKALSYNAQQITSDDINTVKDANFINSLQSKVAGLNISSSSTGIGGAAKVTMRGTKSIEGDNNVMYVIDGIPMQNFSRGSLVDGGGTFADQPTGSDGIADLNSDDIESMSILSGPAAAALYGSGAANGAILVTTKKGIVGKPKITFSNQTTFMNPFVMPEFQNKYGNLPGDYKSWSENVDSPYGYEPKDFFDTGSNVTNSLSVSLGSEKNQTYVSFGTTNASGIVPQNEYDRYNFSARNTTKFLNDKMTLDFGMNYIIQKNQNMVAQGVYFNPLAALYTFPRGENFDDVRLYERYNSTLGYNDQMWDWGNEGMALQNPYWTVNNNKFNAKKDRYMLNTSLQYQVLDWLNLSTRVKIDNANVKETKKLNASTTQLLSGPHGTYYRISTQEKQTYADLLVSINKYFAEDYSLDVHVGTSMQYVDYDQTGLEGYLTNQAFNHFAISNIDLSHPKTISREEGWRHTTASAFASVELGWKSRLYLTLTGRNDWDSALLGMPDESFFYPSVGVSGVLTEMLKMPKFLTYAKVRASYASVGTTIPRNIGVSHYKFDKGRNNYNPYPTYPISQLYPERTKSWELGLDTRWFNNMINVDVTVYKSNTHDQTITVPISVSSGYSELVAQTGNIENRGIEILVGAKKKWGNFFWSSNFTASRNINKIKDLGRYTYIDGSVLEIEDIKKTHMGSAMIFLKPGGTLGDLWTTTTLKHDDEGYIYVNPTTKALAQDEKLQKVGTILPSWNMGLNNSFSWNDITMGFVVSARLGGKGVSYTQAILDNYGVSKASADMRDAGGIAINNGMASAETWYSTVGGMDGIHSYYVYDATNVRLQEASIAYKLPSRWFDNKIKASVSLVGRNLWMIYNKSPFDPESTASTGNYYQGLDYFMMPSLRSYGFNVKLEF